MDRLGLRWVKTGTGRRLVFHGSPEDFDEWGVLWYEEIPHCKEFLCRHELLMSCGIDRACGDCSIHSHQSTVGCRVICRDVGCDDCFRHGDCEKLRRVKD